MIACIVLLEETRALGSNSRATDLISMTTPAVSESGRGKKKKEVKEEDDD